jgi:hypothetical protein
VSGFDEKGCASFSANARIDAADVESPLKPDELQVLRAQYEKEGEYVGLQTKFNYAWVRSHAPKSPRLLS